MHGENIPPMGAVIAVCSEKGGVSKSTIALHLAAYYQENNPPGSLLLVDADPQQALTRWAGEALPEQVVERVDSEDEMFEHLPTWSERYAMTVVDTAGGDTRIARAALFGVDLAVIPCGPTSLDLNATEATLKLVELARRTRRSNLPRVLLAPSKMTRTTLASEVQHQLRQFTETVLDAVPQRAVIADAPTAGDVVWNMGAGDVGELFRNVCRTIIERAQQAHEEAL